jgi:hypothetical protein
MLITNKILNFMYRPGKSVRDGYWVIRFELPEVLMSCLERDFSSITRTCETLRLYRDESGLKFNPNLNEVAKLSKPLYKDSRVVSIYGVLDSGRDVHHPGLVSNIDLLNTSNTVPCVQATGNPTSRMHGV